MRFQVAPLALFLCSMPLFAQTAPTPPVPTTLEEAAAQRERARAMNEEADRRFTAEQAECYRRFLVNACLDEASKRRTQTRIEARQIDMPAREFQREANRAEVEAKEAQRDAENRQREIDQREDAQRFRETEAEKAAERARKTAEKQEQAAAARQKTAADQAERAKREEQYRKQDAERAAQRERQDAEALGAVGARAAPRPD